MTDRDLSAALQGRVIAAREAGEALCIRGGGSKAFYGRAPEGSPLELAGHRGIVNYEPTELVLTARAGTPLREIEAALAERGQMLPFEPPRFGDAATLGGTVACNLSGPRRPYAGAARDFVLGTRVLNGRGEILALGGEVMKNVAGYDVSRLMCGALGTLGVLLEVSLKVLPRPHSELTLVFRGSVAESLARLHDWAQRPYPLTASCFDGDALHVRLCGEERAVAAAHQHMGGDPVADGALFWERLREQRHGFFASDRPLWRLSVASDSPPMELHGKWLHEWGGAQRWLIGDTPAAAVREAAARAGGHASLFRGGDRNAVFHPLPPRLLEIHQRLKRAFDPDRLFNPGRMYQEL